MGKLVFEENVLKFKSFLLRVGSNRLLDGQTLNVSFKSPWNRLAETNRAVRDTVPVLTQSEPWWRRGESNPLATIQTLISDAVHEGKVFFVINKVGLVGRSLSQIVTRFLVPSDTLEARDLAINARKETSHIHAKRAG